jgi:uncharacterized protein YqeY
MSLQDVIKQNSKTINPIDRTIFKTLLGEFDRVNDGKPINDEQAFSVIKKFIKNIDESFYLLEDYPEKRMLLLHEKELLSQFLPRTATIDQMKSVIEHVLSSNSFKNNMQAMKPCIEILQEKGLDIDKKELSNLLKGY